MNDAEQSKMNDVEQRKMSDAEQKKMNDAEQRKMNDAEQPKMNDAEQNGGILRQICYRLSQLNKFPLISKFNELCRSVYTDKQNNLKQKLLLKTIITLVKIFCFP